MIQPPYPVQAEEIESSVSFILNELRQGGEDLDLILLPEACNSPSDCSDSALLKECAALYTRPLLDEVKAAALRCRATVGINLYLSNQDGALQNTTLLFTKEGGLAAKYVKQHLPASEYGNPAIDHTYLTEYNLPICEEVDGVRYGFLTCYDIYYTEYISRLSLEKPDIVLISSLQRAERQDILEMQAKNCAFSCNTYVVRSSFSMGEHSAVGGCSMIVSPDGNVLYNFNQSQGSFDYKIEDPHYKYRRSNGFGQPEVFNDRYQRFYRTPWCYRVGGSGVRPANRETPYPRIGSYRSFSLTAPENTIPCIAVAISLGAVEVGIDVRMTADGVAVVSHDPYAETARGQRRYIHEMTHEELRALNIGGRFSPYYNGVCHATLEEVFSIFPCRTIFNLCLHGADGGQREEDLIRQIVELAAQYDCTEHFYITGDTEAVLAAAARLAPDVERCFAVSGQETADAAVETAQRHGCGKLQASCAQMTEDLIALTHGAGMKCSLSHSGKPEDTAAWLSRGVDTILTGSYSEVRLALERD